MALHFGTRSQSADEKGYARFEFDLAGMSQAIFVELDTMLSPSLQQAVDEAEEGDAKDAAVDALEQARHGWRKLSFGVAKGVAEHLVANLEIHGIETQGTVAVSLSGNTAEVDSHQHGVGTMEGEGTATLGQINEGTGFVS